MNNMMSGAETLEILETYKKDRSYLKEDKTRTSSSK